MVKEYRTIYQNGEAEMVEKKSRFLAHIAHTESEEEALAFIESMKKRYWDATHNCSAYIIGKKGEIMRCSDDGEPSQTAGKPMLDVLMGQKLCDVTAVVTRYFGGTLLGTGGLVRAYSGSVKLGLEASVIVDKKLADELLITADYTNIGKVQYLLAQGGWSPLDTSYTDKVEIILPVPVDQTNALKAKITESTNARVAMEEIGQVYYGVVGKETILFES